MTGAEGGSSGRDRARGATARAGGEDGENGDRTNEEEEEEEGEVGVEAEGFVLFPPNDGRRGTVREVALEPILPSDAAFWRLECALAIISRTIQARRAGTSREGRRRKELFLSNDADDEE